jgi:hypothetical protein
MACESGTASSAFREPSRATFTSHIEYIITDSESSVSNDRVRAFALWEGWFGYDRQKYAAILREAFELFVQCAPKTVDISCLNEPFSEEELKRFPLFPPLALLRS